MTRNLRIVGMAIIAKGAVTTLTEVGLRSKVPWRTDHIVRSLDKAPVMGGGV